MISRKSYILFIDESGKSKFSDPGDHFLLSGLILDKNLHTALSSYMVSLKEKSSIPLDENIHAYHLFEGEKERLRDVNGRVVKNADGTVRHRRIPHGRIDTFFKRLSFLIEGAEIRCFVACMDKSSYRAQIDSAASRVGSTDRAVARYLKRQGLGDFLYEIIARKLILEFGHFLAQEDAIGEVLAESRRHDDDAVFNAFMSATNDGIFDHAPRYQQWAKSCFDRIHSITFQNKKGLSFGLEAADLFGWAYFNKKHGVRDMPKSVAKQRRVRSRIDAVSSIMDGLYEKQPGDISRQMANTIGRDRVSEFTKALAEYR